jgi:hypothetical protein
VSAAMISQSIGRRTSAAWQDTIGWTCPGSRWMATGGYMRGSVRADGSFRTEGGANSWRW